MKLRKRKKMILFGMTNSPIKMEKKLFETFIFRIYYRRNGDILLLNLKFAWHKLP